MKFNFSHFSATSASIIRMMVSTVGTHVFKNAVQRYVATSSSSNTVLPVNFFNAIQLEVNTEQIKLPATVQQIFKDWFKTREAVPTIRVSRRYDNTSTVNITQAGTTSSKFVPISLASTSNSLSVSDKILWLQSNSTGLNSYKIDANDSQWLLVNNQATGGYYRILYDQRNWRLLIAKLKSKNYQSFHAHNRAQLIDDAVHFAQNGLLSYDIVFDLLTYLEKERDFIPWESAKKSLKFFERMLRGSSVNRHFDGLIHKITANLYPELSVTNQNETNYVNRLKRLSVTKLACESGAKQCIAEINEMVLKIVSDSQFDWIGIE